MNATDKPRSGVRKFFANATALLTTDVLNKATNFGIYALVSRYLGTREFGQLSLALLFFYTCQVFTTAGLSRLTTRQIAKCRSRSSRYFANGSAAILVSSTITTLGMMLFAVAMRYDVDTVLVIVILATGLLPFGLSSVVESLFRGWEQMHFIAWANVPANVAKVVGAFLLLQAGFGVVALAILLVACRYGILLIEWALYCVVAERRWSRIDLRFMKRLIGRSSTFLGLEGIIAVWASMNALLLSKFAGESEVGLYVAAHQLLQPALLVYQSIVGGVFPAMCQKAALARQDLAHLIRWIVDLLLLIGLPVAVAIYFTADTLLLLLYGDASFLAAAGVVRILVIVLVLRTITNAFGHALWADSRERTTLRIVTVNLVVNAVCGVVLIRQFGLMGAAWTTLIAWTVNAIQHYIACRDMLSVAPAGRLVWQLFGAAVLMAGCITMLHNVLPIVLLPVVAVLIGSALYVSLATGLLVIAHGGVNAFRAEFFAPLLKS